MNLAGKKGIILGVLNEKSIAAACASHLINSGAEIFCSYLPVEGDKKRRHALATRAVPGLPSHRMLPCDASDDNSIASFFSSVSADFSKIDFVLHCISFVSPQLGEAALSDISRKPFTISMDTSVYSMIAISKHAKKHMHDGGSILTFTHLSSEFVVPGYELLGICKAALQASANYLSKELGPANIRVNVISAPPLPSSSAISHPSYASLRETYLKNSPLRTPPSYNEITKVVEFLVSDSSSGISGERIFVDGGFHNISTYN